jgi:hypothetical protein
MSSSVDFWNLRISRRATVPDACRCVLCGVEGELLLVGGGGAARRGV